MLKQRYTHPNRQKKVVSEVGVTARLFSLKTLRERGSEVFWRSRGDGKWRWRRERRQNLLDVSLQKIDLCPLASFVPTPPATLIHFSFIPWGGILIRTIEPSCIFLFNSGSIYVRYFFISHLVCISLRLKTTREDLKAAVYVLELPFQVLCSSFLPLKLLVSSSINGCRLGSRDKSYAFFN